MLSRSLKATVVASIFGAAISSTGTLADTQKELPD